MLSSPRATALPIRETSPTHPHHSHSTPAYPRNTLTSPVSPPHLSRAAATSFDEDSLLASSVPALPNPVNWKPIAVRLFTTGSGIEEIAGQLNQKVEDVGKFLTGPTGVEMIKEATAGDEEKIRKMLQGLRIDNIMGLVRIARFGDKDATRLTALRTLLEMSSDLGSDLDNMTPAQKKAYLERKLKEREEQSKK